MLVTDFILHLTKKNPSQNCVLLKRSKGLKIPNWPWVVLFVKPYDSSCDTYDIFICHSNIAWRNIFLYIKKQHSIFLCVIVFWWLSSRLATGSGGDVLVVRTSKPVENLWKNGLFWSRYNFVRLAVIDFQNGEQQSRCGSDKKRRNRLR